MAVIASNQITLVDLTDAYGVILTSEAVTIPGTVTNAIATTVTTQVVAMRGAEQVPASVTLSEVTSPSGVTVTKDTNGTAPTLTISVTASVTKAGEVVIPVHIGDITIEKKFGFTIAFKGATGAQGPKGDTGSQGPRGATGSTGPKGDNGLPSYTHIAYADNASGGGFSQDPDGKAYMGVYVDTLPADSSDPSKYLWSLIKGQDGAQGTPGAKGADGKTPYFHTAWADSADGATNFSTTTAGDRSYLGTYTDFTVADSNDATKYVWAKIEGPQGSKGDTGSKGDQGAPGADAITLTAISTNGVTFKNQQIATVLEAHVYRGGLELNETQIGAIGVVKWYQDGETTPVATGLTLTVDAGDVSGKADFIPQLEG